jgi:hypothetical protein
MEALETFLNKYSSKFPKGYPDINNIEDRTLLYEMVYSVLNEKALAWMDLSSETRKYFRLSIIADKIKNEDPFTLETGEETVLKFSNPSYEDLFQNQDIEKIREIGGARINKFPFFKSEDTPISFSDIKKTPDLGGTGGSKAETTERQERALIEAINSIEGVKTLRGKNGLEIQNIISAEKQPDPPRAEAYADIKLNIKGDQPYLLSAKGQSTPSIAGGGLAGATQITPEISEFISRFYFDAYEEYRKILDSHDELDETTNLYKSSYFKDVNREIPKELLFDILRGNEEMGGPVDGYYIGPMDLKYEVEGNTLITNGNIIPIEDFLEQYDKVYFNIKKRGGDYFFTDNLQTVNGLEIPLIFTNKPGGTMAKSRLGSSLKPRGKFII